MYRKIVITGGPCAGKSKLIESASTWLAGLGYKVFCVPETATELISNAHLSPTDDRLSFQRAVLKLQICKEDAICEAVEDYCKMWDIDSGKVVILLDRGAMDGKAYLPESEWKQIITENALSEDALLERYSTVLHLETAAKADKTAFSDENNASRYENAFDAIYVDNRTLSAWGKHPDLRIIKARMDFELKKMQFEMELKTVLGIK